MTSLRLLDYKQTRLLLTPSTFVTFVFVTLDTSFDICGELSQDMASNGKEKIFGDFVFAALASQEVSSY